MKLIKLFTRLIKSNHLKKSSGSPRKKGNPIVNFMASNPKYAQYEIGEWTYGSPIIKSWDHQTKLTIGKFCSFAGNVQILLGGEHRTDWITTYPFSEILEEGRDYNGHPATKGDIFIGNDVWVGQNAIILSGVTIGNGAVIGAGSVVTKHVPPYAIVVGNPAQIIRYRFTEDQIAELENVQWWEWPIEKIIIALPLLLSNQIEALIKHYHDKNLEKFNA